MRGATGQPGHSATVHTNPTRPLRGHRPHEGEGEVRRLALAEARTWLGTPYRHQASVKGAGCDCLGLVRGVWRGLYGAEAEALPPYAPDWAERGGEELMLAAAGRWLVPVERTAARPGDVLLFRMAEGAPVKHCAILSAAGEPGARMIHAYWGRSVIESWMGDWWKRRMVAAFTWRDDEDVSWRR